MLWVFLLVKKGDKEQEDASGYEADVSLGISFFSRICRVNLCGLHLPTDWTADCCLYFTDGDRGTRDWRKRLQPDAKPMRHSPSWKGYDRDWAQFLLATLSEGIRAALSPEETAVDWHGGMPFRIWVCAHFIKTDRFSTATASTCRMRCAKWPGRLCCPEP